MFKALALSAIAIIPFTLTAADARDHAKGVTVLVSQAGYNIDAPKIVSSTVAGTSFTVVNALTGATVYTGTLAPKSGDLGTVYQGDFTGFKTPGTYYVKVGAARSYGNFPIDAQVWDRMIQLNALHYFGLRRMGEDNIVGNLGEYRLVGWEGARTYNRAKHIGRAWADGDDGRVYSSCSLVVAQYCNFADTKPAWDNGDWIYQQVRWGLDGALTFLGKGGELEKVLLQTDHQTVTYDNKLFSFDEKFMTPVSPWESPSTTGNEYDKTNLEAIATSMLIGPAQSVAIYRTRDPEFFGRVEALVKLGYNATFAKYYASPTAPAWNKYSLGAWAWLNVNMHRMTGDVTYQTRAIAALDKLLALQVTAPVNGVAGWYRRDASAMISPFGDKPEQEVMVTPWMYQGIIAAVQQYPTHANAAKWKTSLASYGSYLSTMADRNPYGLTPIKVDAGPTSKLARHAGSLHYQYFAAIGRQFHQIGNAAFMKQIADLTGNATLRDAAWKQMYWFVGHNPLGVSFINGMGTNVASQQYYQTTLGKCFPGGTVNGLTATGVSATDKMVTGGYTSVVTVDAPTFDKFNEYYTYATLQVLWASQVFGNNNAKFGDPISIWPCATRESVHTADPNHPRLSFGVRMKAGQAYRFGANVQADPLNRVAWWTGGIRGGTAATGFISVDGVYTAPAVTSETVVRISCTSTGLPVGISTFTDVTIMPVPQTGPTLSAALVNVTTAYGTSAKTRLTWTASPAADAVSGYTVWKRLPVGTTTAGTVWEPIGVTTGTSYDYPAYDPNNPQFKDPNTQKDYLANNKIVMLYTDNTSALICPTGTQFCVTPYRVKIDPTFIYPKDNDSSLADGWIAGWIRDTRPDPNRVYGYGRSSNIVTR